MKNLAKYKAPAAKLARCTYDRSCKLEHLGFVAIAYVEVLKLEHFVWLVTVYLFVTGSIAVVKDWRS
jgi:hypothetical protein